MPQVAARVIQLVPLAVLVLLGVMQIRSFLDRVVEEQRQRVFLKRVV